MEQRWEAEVGRGPGAVLTHLVEGLLFLWPHLALLRAVCAHALLSFQIPPGVVEVEHVE